MHVTVLLGAPGSGKGTQAKLLAKSGKFRQLSTGDLLRSEVELETPLGKSAKDYISKGELVPDSLITTIALKAISSGDEDTKVLLDGFPRTLHQAEALDADKGLSVKNAIYFSVPEAVLIERLTGRRVCRACGESFHTVFFPPKKEGICDKCGAGLLQRTDDSKEVVEKRLQVFMKQNGQLLEYYRKSGRLNEISADRPVNEVSAQIHQIVS